MKSNELNVERSKAGKRKGRGISAGQGKTAGRGTKGQKARTGGNRRPGFEGGQTPLFMRIPKSRGFTSHKKPATVTLQQLSLHAGEEVSLTSLAAQGIIPKNATSAKVVLSGQVTKKFKLDTSVQASAGAADAIKKAGGSIESSS